MNGIFNGVLLHSQQRKLHNYETNKVMTVLLPLASLLMLVATRRGPCVATMRRSRAAA